MINDEYDTPLKASLFEDPHAIQRRILHDVLRILELKIIFCVTWMNIICIYNIYNLTSCKTSRFFVKLSPFLKNDTTDLQDLLGSIWALAGKLRPTVLTSRTSYKYYIHYIYHIIIYHVCIYVDIYL